MIGIRRLLALGVLLTVAFAAPANAAGKIVVASKIDTEGALLGNMVVGLLQNRGYVVDNRIEIGTTKIVRQALLSGQIDI